ncbi:hydroxyectoine utilization dehydratase EutB [Aquamicrobium zhengzhouense]|uniref:Hydroxyectoine utilization dehydratase EutB n=1 Tax=Aquamicrobium zhengzhouense TaxID=2781738 RepID=A0ABS0SFP0_9HYPH|nr:hydroxyectoine utilization dehydratase EutB [Aquamicrobium zhengzhouense]MBI1621248.1 hydroxyectoine utilization dehydratase EutB [Aquamicrobium zhengzhouense]
MKLQIAHVLSARQTIEKSVIRTPLIPSPYMSGVAGQDFLLKLENTQPSGAFKLRGAANALANLPAGAFGVTCCSTGNHGRAIAYAARARGLRAVICMSELVPQAKVDGIKALGAEVRIVGRSQDDALLESRRLARDENLVEVPPFDDPLVIAGQGTIGLELLEDCPDLSAILVPLSGGGLAAGIALAAKEIKPWIKVIGVSMNRGAAMHGSIRAGRPIEVEEVASLADSLGGGIGVDNSFTFAMCRDLLDDVILVSEGEIYDAMQTLYFEDRLVAEGASVVGIAAMKAGRIASLRGPVATIITGRNLDMAAFTDVVTGKRVTLGSVTVEGRAYGA